MTSWGDIIKARAEERRAEIFELYPTVRIGARTSSCLKQPAHPLVFEKKLGPGPKLPRANYGDAVGPLITGVAAGVGAFLLGPGFTVLGSKLLAAATIGAAAAALGFVRQALAPDIGFGGGNSRILNSTVREPITERRVIYGERRLSGPIVFMETTRDDKLLHMVVPLTNHEVFDITTVFINDDVIFPEMLDSNSNVKEGKYKDKVRVFKKFGTKTQTAFSELVSKSDDWTNDHRLINVSALYLQLEGDFNLFKDIPSVAAVVRGKKVFDPRDSSTKFTDNLALCVRDYLLDDKNGLGYETADLDDEGFKTEANICEEFPAHKEIKQVADNVDASTDELRFSGTDSSEQLPKYVKFVTGDRVQVTSTGSIPDPLSKNTDYFVIVKKHRSRVEENDNNVLEEKEPAAIQLASSLSDALQHNAIDLTSSGSGTIEVVKNAEPRYRCNGAVKADQQFGTVLEDMLSAGAASLTYVGGLWQIRVGVWRTPDVSFDETDVIDSISVQTKVRRRERFNTVRGEFSGPINDWQPQPAPIRVDEQSKSSDGGQKLTKTLNLPFVNSPQTAQRLFEIELRRARQEIAVDTTFNMEAFQVKIGDNIGLNFEKYGWDITNSSGVTGKLFEVKEWNLKTSTVDGTPSLSIPVTVRETAPENFEFDKGKELEVDPAPNTKLPDQSVVRPPQNVSAAPFEDVASEGKIALSWDSHGNALVNPIGKFEVQWKKTNESNYDNNVLISGDRTRFILKSLEINTDFDVRIRAVSSSGSVSEFVTINSVGTGDGASLLTSNLADQYNELLNPRFEAADANWETAASSWTVERNQAQARRGKYAANYSAGSTSRAILQQVNFISVGDQDKLLAEGFFKKNAGAGFARVGIVLFDINGNETEFTGTAVISSSYAPSRLVVDEEQIPSDIVGARFLLLVENADSNTDIWADDIIFSFLPQDLDIDSLRTENGPVEKDAEQTTNKSFTLLVDRTADNVDLTASADTVDQFRNTIDPNANKEVDSSVVLNVNGALGVDTVVAASRQKETSDPNGFPSVLIDSPLEVDGMLFFTGSAGNSPSIQASQQILTDVTAKTIRVTNSNDTADVTSDFLKAAKQVSSGNPGKVSENGGMVAEGEIKCASSIISDFSLEGATLFVSAASVSGQSILDRVEVSSPSNSANSGDITLSGDLKADGDVSGFKVVATNEEVSNVSSLTKVLVGSPSDTNVNSGGVITAGDIKSEAAMLASQGVHLGSSGPDSAVSGSAQLYYDSASKEVRVQWEDGTTSLIVAK